MTRAAFCLAAAAGLWAAAILLAPAALTSSHPHLAAIGAAIYAAGGFICHQRPERSFHLAGVQMPVCARCTGLYLSAAIGAPLALAAAAIRIGGVSTLVVVALPTAITWTAEMLGLAHPSNMARALAALPLGFAAAWLVIGAMRRDSG